MHRFHDFPGSLRTGLVAVLLLLPLGCGSSDGRIAEVTGQVTYLGRPATADITFHAKQTDAEFGGRPSTASTDEDGSFRLFFTPDQPGALVGQHRVIIKVYPGDDSGGEAIAKRSFTDATTPVRVVTLERFVSGDDNNFAFHLRP